MMQDGLHIGLAAWIHQQRSTGGFVVYPASPIVQPLVELESIQNARDLAQAAEFARLVNFIPRQGQVADPFNDAAVLWRVHRNVLGMMDHATEPWSKAERASYQVARDVLYTTDATGYLAPSQKRLRYDEYRIAYQDLQRTYQDLQIAGDSSAEELLALAGDVAKALADWMLAGYKNEVEDALEVIAALAARSSLGQAQNEALLLSQDPPGIGLRFHGDMEFAATYFAPISAIDHGTWMQGKVSFADFDGAVGNNPPNNRWKAYLANRAGEVSFDYAVLNCIRPWYTPELYRTDDWRLRPEGTVVSRGNGTDGLLPAYVESVYLAVVKDITNAPTAPQREKLPRIQNLERLNEIEMNQLLREMRANLEIMNKVTDSPLVMRPRSTLKVDVPSRRVPLNAALIPNTASFVATRSGQMRKVTVADINYRHAVLLASLTGQSSTSTTQPEATPSLIYAVGFGCEKIPLAPNPNVNYRWD